MMRWWKEGVGEERLSITDQLLKRVEEDIGYHSFVSPFPPLKLIFSFQ